MFFGRGNGAGEVHDRKEIEKLLKEFEEKYKVPCIPI